MTQSFEAVIGLEVHCQLQTNSKAFSPDSAAFGAEPNRHVDPISLGHPGTLPVLNGTVVEYAVRMGLATHCQIAPRSVLARKHYFYPDLPKGYQISQYETPICAGGYVDVISGDEIGEASIRRIGVTRIHIEEDAGKSIHDADPLSSLLDYNRCGVPLIELVSEPDLRSPREAYHFLRRIRQLVRYLDICDGNMEEGSLRCDANVSVRPVGQQTLGTKTEVKNMNSFRNVERALTYEIQRQIRLVRNGETITQETLLWDVNEGRTRSMRGKEEAHDYRYFPDPDLPPIVLTERDIDRIRVGLPELPEARVLRLTGTLGLPEYDAEVLADEREVGDYFDACMASLKQTSDVTSTAKAVSNVIMTHVLRLTKESGTGIEDLSIGPERLAGLVQLRLDDSISSSGLQEILAAMLQDGRPAEAIASGLDLLQISDDGALQPFVGEVIREYPNQVAQYHDGKAGLIGFFMGQVMKRFPGSADPQRVRALLLERLAIKDRSD